MALLLVPTGLAAALVVAGTVTASRRTARAAPAVVAVGARGGLVLAWPGWRLGRWPLLAASACCSSTARPVLLSGQATFTGYIKLDDTGDLVQHHRPRDGARALGQRRTAIDLLARLQRRRRPRATRSARSCCRASARALVGHRHRVGLPALPGVLRGGARAVRVRADRAARRLAALPRAARVPRAPSRRCCTATACGAGSRS